MVVQCARALVVEDDADMRALVQEVLRPIGEIVGVPDVYQALAMLQHDDFDVVVLDLLFPGASGFDLMERLTKMGRDIPVVILTGLTSDVALRRARALGAHAFVTKPFDVDMLLVTVRDAAAQRSRHGTASSANDVVSLAPAG